MNLKNLKENKKTICIAVPLYYPHPGGYESYVKRLSEVLCSNGYNVIIVTCALSKNAPSKEIENSGTTVIRLDSYLGLKGRFPIDKKNSHNKRLFSWIKDQKIDYFIINTRFYSLSTRVAKFANSLGIKPVLIDHGSAHLVLGNKLIDPVVEFVEHYLTNKLKKYNIAYYGISKASVKWLNHFNIKGLGVLPNAVNAKDFLNNASSININKKLSIPKGSFIVYFIGRYTKEKGVLQLLEAAKIMQKHKDIHFVLCGKGKYNSLINSYSKTCNIHNLGTVNPSDVAALMKQSSVLCLPTRSEGFCTSLLEASACKLPSIITHVGGTDELIPDKSYGYILKDAEPKTIVNAIIYMKENRKKLPQMGEKTFWKVQNEYNWNIVSKKVIEACKLNND